VADFATFAEVGGQPSHRTASQVEIDLGLDLDLRRDAFGGAFERSLNGEDRRGAFRFLQRPLDIAASDCLQSEQDGQ